MINISLYTTLDGKALEEVWTGKPINYSRLRVFGSPYFLFIQDSQQYKFAYRAKKCFFLGFNKGVKNYKLWAPSSHKIAIRRDIVFNEERML